MENNDWVKKVWHCLGTSSTLVWHKDIDDEMKIKGDILQNTLLCRLKNHIKRRIVDKNKHEHWCLIWTSQNIAQMAGIVMILDHIKPDIQCLDQTSTLLKSSNNFVEVTENEGNKEGAYLYFDKNNMNWIPSGKVTGRGFFIRHAEHKKQANYKRADFGNSKLKLIIF